MTKDVDGREKELTHQVHREWLIRSLEQVKTLTPVLISGIKIFITTKTSGTYCGFLRGRPAGVGSVANNLFQANYRLHTIYKVKTSHEINSDHGRLPKNNFQNKVFRPKVMHRYHCQGITGLLSTLHFGVFQVFINSKVPRKKNLSEPVKW